VGDNKQHLQPKQAAGSRAIETAQIRDGRKNSSLSQLRRKIIERNDITQSAN
jgi:hypothetical protein